MKWILGFLMFGFISCEASNHQETHFIKNGILFYISKDGKTYPSDILVLCRRCKKKVVKRSQIYCTECRKKRW